MNKGTENGVVGIFRFLIKWKRIRPSPTPDKRNGSVRNRSKKKTCFWTQNDELCCVVLCCVVREVKCSEGQERHQRFCLTPSRLEYLLKVF